MRDVFLCSHTDIGKINMIHSLCENNQHSWSQTIWFFAPCCTSIAWQKHIFGSDSVELACINVHTVGFFQKYCPGKMSYLPHKMRFLYKKLKKIEFFFCIKSDVYKIGFGPRGIWKLSKRGCRPCSRHWDTPGRRAWLRGPRSWSLAGRGRVSHLTKPPFFDFSLWINGKYTIFDDILLRIS